jgi:hypothetical protein
MEGEGLMTERTIIERRDPRAPRKAASYAEFQIAAFEGQKRKIRAEIKAKVEEGNKIISEINEEIRNLKKTIPR